MKEPKVTEFRSEVANVAHANGMPIQEYKPHEKPRQGVIYVPSLAWQALLEYGGEEAFYVLAREWLAEKLRADAERAEADRRVREARNDALGYDYDAATEAVLASVAKRRGGGTEPQK